MGLLRAGLSKIGVGTPNIIQPPSVLFKTQPKELRRAVTIRRDPSYEAKYLHYHADGKTPKALRPSPVYFLGHAGDNKGWSYIYYTYDKKQYYGYIHNGNFTSDVPIIDYSAYGGSNFWNSGVIDKLVDSYNPKPTEVNVTYLANTGGGGGGGVGETSEDTVTELVSVITASSDVATPAHLTKFTNPESSLGYNYRVFSPYPDPNTENELISSKNQYEEPFNIFVLPGYTPARMTIYTYVGNKQVARSFEFLVGPSSMTESNINSIVPLKTGAGFFLLRNGAELGRLNISGYLLESDAVDERRLFMENYYRSYMIDKVNTFHSYFNESSLYLELEGYRYQCVLQNLDLTKAVESMFLFRYSMNLLVLSQEPMGVVKTPRPTTVRAKQSLGGTEIVRGASVILGAAAGLAY